MIKSFLLYKNKDFTVVNKEDFNEENLIQDLELETLFSYMSCNDKFIYETVKNVVLSSLKAPSDILYRQDILKDCIKNYTIIKDIYDISIQAIENEKKNFLGIFSNNPSSILSRSANVLEMFMSMIKKLRNIAYEYNEKFESEGFNNFFSMLKNEFNDEYSSIVESHLKECRSWNEIYISVELGQGNKGINYILRKPNEKKKTIMSKLFNKDEFIWRFYIGERDERGIDALAELQGRGINIVANILAQSVDGILSFFSNLRMELAFYIGCMNLKLKLEEIGEPTTFPMPLSIESREFDFNELYDVCLALNMKGNIVGNKLKAQNKNLVIITGANQGGKSTFLRSLGLAQVMMQCGMFVPADNFSANICEGIFTHYRRQEDSTMKSGKLDEELNRMNKIIEHITPNSIIYFNESLAATNEREGSEIARQITNALIEKNIKVVFVTHFFDYASSFYNKELENAVFLRAERKENGERSFNLVEGEPLKTSFGEDLYKDIFDIN
ncbi:MULTISPECIES: mismatch repair ATPase (MutS family) [unclassified Clostridium]|uniref:MutS-related protein n=1 Tax=unclassified Clostridium TaxID=2614128 RepID=UPI0002974213|nr:MULTISPECIES: mismatch repair ATPase (MutS family) [unclassified Clostridium]EKQ54355.1 MAG: mismatch repair ATPase (MutS family) [Clostridium sp. Maddingley MBC34-26]